MKSEDYGLHWPLPPLVIASTPAKPEWPKEQFPPANICIGDGEVCAIEVK